MPSGGIHIFASQLHTHGTGIEVETRHFRDGQEMPEVNKDPHYSAHFQEIRPLHNIITVLPVSVFFISDTLSIYCFTTFHSFSKAKLFQVGK